VRCDPALAVAVAASDISWRPYAMQGAVEQWPECPTRTRWLHTAITQEMNPNALHLPLSRLSRSLRNRSWPQVDGPCTRTRRPANFWGRKRTRARLLPPAWARAEAGACRATAGRYRSPPTGRRIDWLLRSEAAAGGIEAPLAKPSAGAF
jgi:hypothetical protein